MGAGSTGATRSFWTARRESISEGLGGRDNALGLVRLVLAAAVIFSHAFPLGGWGTDPTFFLTRGQSNLGGLAVFGFFAVSGYLIAKSGTRTDILAFLWHRVLRIFPAFWLVLLVGAVIVAPLWWLGHDRDLGSYVSAPVQGPFDYLIANALLDMKQYGIVDVFLDTPYGATAGSVLNGSLWTLLHEFVCYLVIGGLVLLTVMRRPRVAQVVLLVLLVGLAAIQAGHLILERNAGALIPFLGDLNRQQLLYAFIAGSCLAVFSRSIPLDARIAIPALAVVVVTALVGGFALFGLPLVAYVLLWAAARLPRSWRWIGARDDYSYGMYLYGFLVQQSLAYLGVYHWGYAAYVGITLVITAGCAWLSWHLLEKRALAIKDRGPGRGFAYWVDRTRVRAPKLATASAEKEET